MYKKYKLVLKKPTLFNDSVKSFMESKDKTKTH